jgi:hypothetical protein
MNDSPDNDQVATRLQADAQAASAWRVLAVTALATFAAVVTKYGEWTSVDVLRNGALAIAAWWALMPGLRNGGAEFGRRYHWSSFLFLPAAVLTAVTALSLWNILSL